MHAAESLSALTALLRTELELAGQLESTLDQERAAIAAGTAEALESVLGEKNRLIARLTHLGGEREAALLRAGCTADLDGVRSLLDRHGADGDLLGLWSEVTEAGRRCREKNRVNGGLVEVSLQAVRQALGLLRGDDQAPVYGPAGRALSEPSSRPLAKA